MVEQRQRLWAIDALRGIVMVLMALDHVRDFWAGTVPDPTDLSNPANTAGWFLTRWITHFCAPVFVLLAGTSAWLYGSRGRTRGELSRFLVTRGLWLIVLEFSVVYFAWMNSFASGILFFQVIGAIGVSMCVLAALVQLPRAAVACIGLALALGHNALDGVVPDDLGPLWWLWVFLHEGSLAPFRLVPVGGVSVMVIYPLLPWIGVMALGYAIGPWMQLTRAARGWRLALTGLLCLGLFIWLRSGNLYGEPVPWSEQGDGLRTALSFLNTTKYPPSLLFLCMTLGPASLALVALEREPGALGRVLVTFGRVPLFFYVAHLFLAHGAARLYYWAVYGEPLSLMQAAFTGRYPEWFAGLPLWGVYVAWALVVLALWAPCAWYARLKQRSNSVLLSYL